MMTPRVRRLMLGCLLLTLALVALALGAVGAINPGFYGCSHGVTRDYSLALVGFASGVPLLAKSRAPSQR